MWAQETGRKRIASAATHTMQKIRTTTRTGVGFVERALDYTDKRLELEQSRKEPDMEISTVFGGDTLKAADLQGQEPVVTIATVTLKEFDKGNKLVITFVGKKKALVANKTNSNRIAFLHGTNTDNWIGKKIQLYTDLVDFQGSTVEAIRVRPVKQQPDTSAQGMMQQGENKAQSQVNPNMAQPIPFNDSVADIGDTF